MTPPQLSARARLTLVYTGLVALCGSVLIAVTYLLVSHSLSSPNQETKKPVPPDTFIEKCVQSQRLVDPTNPSLKTKCADLYAQGVTSGAQSQRSATMSHLLTYSLLALLAVTAMAAVVGWLLAGRILRPVRQLTAAAKAAGEHTLSHRLALRGPRDELRELADTFDDMLARLDTAFASQRHFISNASHELRTPLTVMRTSIDVTLAKPHPDPADYAAMGSEVSHAVDHAESLINALLTLARNERGLTIQEAVDLAALAEEVLDTIPAPGLTVTKDLDPAGTLGDPILIERLIANLIDNAVRYNLPDGTIHIATTSSELGATLSVVNTGPVIAAHRLPDLFEPFTRLTERTSQEGFGLGLALVSSIAAMHAATITTEAPSSGGLHISVVWPHGAPMPTATTTRNTAS